MRHIILFFWKNRRWKIITSEVLGTRGASISSNTKTVRDAFWSSWPSQAHVLDGNVQYLDEHKLRRLYESPVAPDGFRSVYCTLLSMARTPVP